MTSDNDLLCSIDGAIARATFNRPQARNALTFAMYERLASFCEEASATPGVRSIIITGAGDKAFAAGTDISQFLSFSKPQDAIDYEERVGKVVERIERCPTPTIAAIAGACTGGGAAIAVACDIRVAAANVRIGMPIARTLGNCLSKENYARFANLIGAARVKEMIFTGRLIEAEEARAIGLVHEIVPPDGDLMARAEALAATIAGHAPLTLRATKESLRRLAQDGPAAQDQDIILSCYMSEDFREGMEAFLAKRPPQWRGV
ncbi:MAG: enoyl-CoA hydratase/isomerase family protein [Elsteraceae bacterium]